MRMHSGRRRMSTPISCISSLVWCRTSGIRKQSILLKGKQYAAGQVDILSEKVADPLLQALLQGKFNQANELGISMVIHPDSRLEGSFAEEKQDALLTALGNVIENALESVKQKEDGQRKVAIFYGYRRGLYFWG